MHYFLVPLFPPLALRFFDHYPHPRFPHPLCFSISISSRLRLDALSSCSPLINISHDIFPKINTSLFTFFFFPCSRVDFFSFLSLSFFSFPCCCSCFSIATMEKRNKIREEICDSERDYVATLQTLNDVIKSEEGRVKKSEVMEFF